MIAVSDSFKKAIKSDNREIYGYVDVEFDSKDKDYYVETKPTSNILSMSDGSDLLDQNKKMINYATLENNYFLLDGSFKLANTNVQHNAGGFISNDIYQNIENNTIAVDANENGEVETPGISIYFKDNLAINFTITVIDTNDEEFIFDVTNNNKYNYYIIFDEPITIKSISLSILQVEYPNRRLRIPEISLTPSDVYEGDELISFTIDEEIDVSYSSVPINTCTININNYPDSEGGNKFDPINPKGLTSYLTENTQIKPYIGVLTEDSGVEYVPMGTFYLSDWSTDVDGNVTLNGQSIMGVFKNKPTVSTQGILTTFRTDDVSDLIKNIYGINIRFHMTDFETNMRLLKDANIFDWIVAYNNYNGYWKNNNQDYDNYLHISLFKADRYNNLDLYNYSFDISRNIPYENDDSDVITRHNLLQDAEFINKSKINTVEMKYIKPWSMNSDTQEYSLNTTYTLTKTEEYVWFSLGKYTPYGSTFSYTKTGSGTATLIDSNNYLLYVKLNGAVGETFTLKYYGYVYNNPSTTTKIYTNDIDNGEKISVDLTNYLYMDDDKAEALAQYYLDYSPKYDVKLESIGLPHFEAHDPIFVQTRYNDSYKLILITKHQITYDGGVTSSIEGVSY